MERITQDAGAEIELPSDATDRERLAAAMSEVSEDQYCAAWLIDNEYNLWALVRQMVRNQYGLGPVDEAKLNRIWELHQKTGGWVIWVRDEELGRFGIEVPAGADPLDVSGAYFVTTAEWEPMFSAWELGLAFMGTPVRRLSDDEWAQHQEESAVRVVPISHICDFEGRTRAVEKFRQEKGLKPLAPYYVL